MAEQKRDYYEARISAISLAIFSVISLGAAEEAEGQAAAQ